MFADGCLACRNPGEHLKLDGLHGTGWVAGGSAFVSSFRPRSRHPEISPGFQPGFHLSSSSLRQCVAGCEAPKECVETEDEVAGCCCWWRSGERGKKNQGENTEGGCPCRQGWTLTLTQKGETIRSFRRCAGLCFGIYIVCAGKATEMLQRPCIFGPSYVLPPGQGKLSVNGSRSRSPPDGRISFNRRAFLLPLHPVHQQGSVRYTALNLKCTPNSKHP